MFKEVAAAFGHRKRLESKPGIGYKRLPKDLIVELEIGPVHNQCRSRMVNENWAKCRAKQPRCLRILDTLTMEWVQTPVQHFWDTHSFAIYEPGQEVRYNTEWEPDVTVICGPGIHYFLTLEAAFCYDLLRTTIFVRVQDGQYCAFDDNGHKGPMWDNTHPSISTSWEDMLFEYEPHYIKN
jgi:hypothetical protein